MNINTNMVATKTSEAYGFLTRGCPRQCDFCIVSKKEGCKSQKVADLSEFYTGQSREEITIAERKYHGLQ